VNIRLLDGEDAEGYHELRMRALREHPEAFATSCEEELQRTEAEIAGRLTPTSEHVTFGAFSSDEIVGIATLTRPAKAKLRHRATLSAMYVAPTVRGSGVGHSLLQALLEQARSWGVADVGLAVTVGNAAARRLYITAGFTPYAVEPRSINVDGCFHDVEWMLLSINGAEPPPA
jgi:GNAT superfamily N-acetyltransferase